MSRAFEFIPVNRRDRKPRTVGLTEIRGPYYTNLGQGALKEILHAMGDYIDSLKYAGGSFVLMPPDVVMGINDTAHAAGVEVSTGGFIERVLSLPSSGTSLVDYYIQECKKLRFDIIEISTGFITLPIEDELRLIEKVSKAGLKPKPEVGIQFGAGGSTSESELKAAGIQDVGYAIQKAKRFLDAGASIIMMESEGVTENVHPWRTDVPAQFIHALGLQHVMFEAADPAVFQWYIKNYGPEVNLFVDHSQIIQLESLRSGTWGPQSLWGRVATFK